MHRLRILFTDLAGIGLIVLAFLVGWIPGPGGIPLLLAGLGLLSLNHAWARRLLRRVKTHGLKFAELFFREHRGLMIVYDVVALLLVAAGVVVLINIQGFFRASATVLFFLGLGLFLGNRKRLQRITTYFRRQP